MNEKLNTICGNITHSEIIEDIVRRQIILVEHFKEPIKPLYIQMTLFGDTEMTFISGTSYQTMKTAQPDRICGISIPLCVKSFLSHENIQPASILNVADIMIRSLIIHILYNSGFSQYVTELCPQMRPWHTVDPDRFFSNPGCKDEKNFVMYALAQMMRYALEKHWTTHQEYPDTIERYCKIMFTGDTLGTKLNCNNGELDPIILNEGTLNGIYGEEIKLHYSGFSLVTKRVDLSDELSGNVKDEPTLPMHQGMHVSTNDGILTYAEYQLTLHALGKLNKEGVLNDELCTKLLYMIQR